MTGYENTGEYWSSTPNLKNNYAFILTFVSKEDNTPAEKLKQQIHHATKTSRYNKIMKLQMQIFLQ